MNRKVNSEGEKAGDEGRLNPSIKSCPIKKVEFFLIFINSHRKKDERERQMKGAVVFISLLSFSGLFFSLRQGTRLAVSEWLSWEKHQYPFIHTITHI